jgi:hypothetical protein
MEFKSVEISFGIEGMGFLNIRTGAGTPFDKLRASLPARFVKRRIEGGAIKRFP